MLVVVVVVNVETENNTTNHGTIGKSTE